MRKQWLGICIAASLLAACTSDDGQQQATVAPPQPAVCNGPIVEISGADPVYEPLNASANQDYQRDGKSYKIVQDPSRFSQAGFARSSEAFVAAVPEVGSAHAENPQTAGRRGFSAGKTG